MGSIPTQVLRFFFQEEKSQDLYTSATVMIIMAILLCQIYVQSVEYILDDQTINSEQVCGSIVHLH